ncbi:MAG: transporter [Chlorobiota bacterium]
MKLIRFIGLAAIISLSFVTTKAQTQETIDSDRPGQSFTPHTVGTSVLQLQSGVNFKLVGAEETDNVISNLTNIRYGLSEMFEINGTVGYGIVGTPNETLNGINNLRLGARANFSQQEGYTPGFGVNVDFLFALGTEVYNDPYEDINTTLILTQKVADNLNATTNIGIYYDQLSGDILTPFTLNGSYSLSENTSIFAEIYGELQPNFGINFDFGGSYLVNDDFLLDFAVEIEDQEVDNDFWIEAGVSYRLK